MIVSLLHKKLLTNLKLIFPLSTSSQLHSKYIKLFKLKSVFKDQQLKQSYIDLVKFYHPDLSNQPNSGQKFKDIQDGYKFLGDYLKNNPPRTSNTSQQPKKQQSAQYVEMKQKYFKNHTRKDPVNDELNFSYNLFKKHYQKVQEIKRQYKKYDGKGQNYYAKKDQKAEYLWKPVVGGITMIGILIGSYAVINS